MAVYALLSLAGCLFGVAGFAFGLWGVIAVEAYKRSTHKIEWRPIESPPKVTPMDFLGEEEKKLFSALNNEKIEDFTAL